MNNSSFREHREKFPVFRGCFFRGCFSKGFLALTVCTLLVGGCGGGGSDSGDKSFGLDACGGIGLKIANGRACQAGDNPAATSVVRLDITSLDGSGGECTGTVISSRAVLTAAHCFIDGARSVTVTTTNGSLEASRVVTHPDFAVNDAQQVFYNDAAIVFTDTNLPVAAAALLESRSPIVGEEAVVAGFGQTSPDSDFGTINAGNAFVDTVTANHVIIRFEGNQSHPCKGDSGGALFLLQGSRLVIAGVVSQSDPSVGEANVCRKGDITLYTNTQSIASFIFGQVPGAAQS